jgi:hypothetical protein
LFLSFSYFACPSLRAFLFLFSFLSFSCLSTCFSVNVFSVSMPSVHFLVCPPVSLCHHGCLSASLSTRQSSRLAEELSASGFFASLKNRRVRSLTCFAAEVVSASLAATGFWWWSQWFHIAAKPQYCAYCAETSLIGMALYLEFLARWNYTIKLKTLLNEVE